MGNGGQTFFSQGNLGIVKISWGTPGTDTNGGLHREPSESIGCGLKITLKIVLAVFVVISLYINNRTVG